MVYSQSITPTSNRVYDIGRRKLVMIEGMLNNNVPVFIVDIFESNYQKHYFSSLDQIYSVNSPLENDYLSRQILALERKNKIHKLLLVSVNWTRSLRKFCITICKPLLSLKSRFTDDKY